VDLVSGCDLKLGAAHNLRDGVVALHDGNVFEEVGHVEVRRDLLLLLEQLLAQALIQLDRLVEELFNRIIIVRLSLIGNN
jgi:hypothetical protein